MTNSPEKIRFDDDFELNLYKIYSEETSDMLLNFREEIESNTGIPETDKFLYLQYIDLRYQVLVLSELDTSGKRLIVLEGTSGVGKSTMAQMYGDIHGYEVITDNLEMNVFLRHTKTKEAATPEFATRNQLMFMILKSRQVIDALRQSEITTIVIDSWSMTELAHVYAFLEKGIFGIEQVSLLEKVRQSINFSSKLDLRVFEIDASEAEIKRRIMGRGRDFEVDNESIDFQILVHRMFVNLPSSGTRIDTTGKSPEQVMVELSDDEP
ncbi:MAG TPA: deoxynucleoside kinase [Candidatus Woesebacteria bacterium]|nr:deoxynucleoside kinase [Candidatus Woesebacteria bacterium]